MADVEIDLLGRFEVRVDGRGVPAGAWTRRSASALVKLLSLAPGRSLHRERVLDALWPDLPPDEAQPRLHTAAHYARRALGVPSAVVLRGEAVHLLPECEVAVDTERFAALVRSPSGADAALAAYGGDLLPDDLFEPWTEAERERLRRLYLELLRAAGRWDDVLALEPADEPAHLALMRAAADRGDRHGALRQFERLDRALRAELGVAPGPEAVALRDRLLAADDVPRAPLPRLVGRRPVLERVDRALAEARAGRGRTLLVGGPGGMGTTSVLDWARARARAEGMRVGAGAAASSEGSWPYAPVLEALADLARGHPALLDGLDDGCRSEIERALRGGELSWSGEGGHQRLFVSAAELLRLAAAGAGALVTVDDVHDADEASMRLLHYLARVVAAEPVVLVLGHRPAVPGSRLDELRGGLLRRRAAVDLPLPPLSAAGTAALLAERLGTPPPEERVREVHALSAGVPRRALDLATSRRLPLSGLLADCPPGTEEVLRRVAVAGATFDTDEFVALAGTDEEAAFAVLDALLGAGVVDAAPVGYRLRHAAVRDALLDGLPPHRLQRLHRHVASALEGMQAPPARVAGHLLQAGDRVAAVPHLLRAAETAAALGAHRDALDLVEQARGAAAGDERRRVLVLRADLLLAIGDPAAVAAYREATAAASAEESRGLRARLARSAAMLGDRDTAVEALAGLELDGGTADSSILLARGALAWFAGDVAAAAAAADAARERLGGTGDWRLLDLVVLQGLIAHRRGEWFQRLRYELQSTRESPALATAVFDGHLCVAEFLLYGPTPYPEVLELGRALRRTAERAGALRAVAFACTLTGEAALLSGDLATAERDLLEAVALHADIGATSGEAHSLQRLAEVLVVRGDRGEARRLLRRALTLARWSPISGHLLQRIHGTLIAAADNPVEAHAAAELAQATVAPEDACPSCQVMVSVPSAIACADAGDLDAARAHLAAAERSAPFWEGTAWQAALLEARAHLVLAEGDGPAAERLLTEAVERFEFSGQPLDAARCRRGLPVPAP